jgi:hypothetical protein
MPGSYLIINIPEAMLKAAHDSVKSGQCYTMHVEVKFNPANPDAEILDAGTTKKETEDKILVPASDIEKILEGKA